MAKRKKRKIGWLSKLLFCICTPLIIWFLAFLIWFYWNDITGHVGQLDKTPSPKANNEVDRPTKFSDERIGEEDRRKLDDILKSKK